MKNIFLVLTVLFIFNSCDNSDKNTQSDLNGCCETTMKTSLGIESEFKTKILSNIVETKPLKQSSEVVTNPLVAIANPKISYIDVEESVHFDGSDSYSNVGEIVSYEWSDQEKKILSTKAVFDRTFYYPGIYIKTLSIKDDQNNSAIDQNVIVVGDVDDYIIFTQPDFETITLSSTNFKASQIVQSKLIKYDDTTNSIDHWIFNHDGGELEINLLSEMSNGNDFIDLDQDGKQSELDLFVYLFKKDEMGNWQFVEKNDDYYLLLGGSSDGSTHYYDSYIKSVLDKGEYMISVGTYPFSENEALKDRKNSTSVYEGIEGPYQISFNKKLDFISVPTYATYINQNEDFFTLDVLANDFIINGAYDDNLTLIDATLIDLFGDIKIKNNKILYYPKDDLDYLQEGEMVKVDIVYRVKNRFSKEQTNTLTLSIVK